MGFLVENNWSREQMDMGMGWTRTLISGNISPTLKYSHAIIRVKSLRKKNLSRGPPRSGKKNLKRMLLLNFRDEMKEQDSKKKKDWLFFLFEKKMKWQFDIDKLVSLQCHLKNISWKQLFKGIFANTVTCFYTLHMKITEFCYHSFSKNFRQTKVLLKKLIANWFDEKKKTAWQFSRFFTLLLCSANCKMLL